MEHMDIYPEIGLERGAVLVAHHVLAHVGTKNTALETAALLQAKNVLARVCPKNTAPILEAMIQELKLINH
ncbi:hypothetical protein FACS189472_00580 [Alphaproteobacteria bacterium]|nr:hypothetical protein FACS189472_00580 [Alphaproteobacteria bacterium]